MITGIGCQVNNPYMTICLWGTPSRKSSLKIWPGEYYTAKNSKKEIKTLLVHLTFYVKREYQAP